MSSAHRNDGASNEHLDEPFDEVAPQRHVVVRILTMLAALAWGVGFFGIVDLLVVPLQDERFHEHYLLETGWGLLFTVLVVVPLMLWVVRPRWRVLPQQVVAVAGAILLTGAMASAAGQVLVAAILLVTAIILLLALFGIGGFIGNIGIGVIVDRSYRILAVVTPFVIAAMALLMNAFTGSLWAIGVVVFVWGFFFASWLLIVNTWIGHRMPDRLEAGGSLVVMGFQAAIMTAAAVGGALVDGIGITQVYVIGAAVLVVGAVLFGLSDRLSRR